ncbi:MAG: MFS transporter [Candidatus Riflebacteria bacterium]|nr:MFS transporter [Candidatus Riflebacteria bacterium]
MHSKKKPFLFAQRQFFRLWLGQVTSQAGTRVYQIAIVWWILTSSAEHGGFSLGAFMVAGALPSLLFYKLIGRVVDRMPAKVMLVACDLSSAALMGYIAWCLSNETLTLEMAYIFGFLVAVAEGFFNPAITKCLPSLVSEEDLEQAVAYQASTQYLASFGGSVLGALLIAWLGIPLLVMINAISYVFSALIEMTLEFPETVSDKASADGTEHIDSVETRPATEPENHDTDTKALWQKFPLLKQLLIGFGLVNFFATPTLVIVPLYVQKSLEGNATIMGLLEAALWIGILIGTFVAAMIRTQGRTIRMGSLSMMIYGVCMIVPGLLINTWAFGLALMLAGASLGINNVKFVTLFQRVVPDQVKGRFFAAMQAIIGFSFPVAYLAFGYLGDLMSPARLCLIQAAGIILVAIWFYHLAPGEAALMNYEETSEKMSAE